MHKNSSQKQGTVHNSIMNGFLSACVDHVLKVRFLQPLLFLAKFLDWLYLGVVQPRLNEHDYLVDACEICLSVSHLNIKFKKNTVH